MTSRYGDWVLLQPPVKGTTLVLWFGPGLLLLVGGFFVYRFVRRSPQTAVPDPLSAEEEQRLKRIMKDNDL